MLNDPISDMLSRIKNAINAGHDRVEFPASKIKASICKVLKEEGYIRGFKVISKEGFVSIKSSKKRCNSWIEEIFKAWS